MCTGMSWNGGIRVSDGILGRVLRSSRWKGAELLCSCLRSVRTSWGLWQRLCRDVLVMLRRCPQGLSMAVC